MTSWAIVDYFLRPKPAYFAIKRELRLYTVGMTRKEKKTYPDESSAAKFTIETVLEIWGTNSTLTAKTATLEVTSFKLDDPAYANRWTTKPVTLAPNASTELFAGAVPELPTRTKLSEVPPTVVISARLLDEHGAVLGRYSNWYVPNMFCHLTPKQPLNKSFVLCVYVHNCMQCNAGPSRTSISPSQTLRA